MPDKQKTEKSKSAETRKVRSVRRQLAAQEPGSRGKRAQPAATTAAAKPKLMGSWSLMEPSIALWRGNFETGMVLTLLPFFLSELGITLVGEGRNSAMSIRAGFAIVIAGLVWLAANTPALYYLQTRAVRGEQPGLSECYRHGFRKFWPFMGLSVIISLYILGGLLLLIVPGLILLRRYYLAPYYLIDRDVSLWEAMRQSAADSKPVAGAVWGVLGVAVALALTGSVIGGLFRGNAKPIGDIIAALIGYLYLFGPALRYREITETR